jgi:ArsR family transcriptional regulator, arsenate/arsenite/antimonite-responsive transcriptional repressor
MQLDKSILNYIIIETFQYFNMSKDSVKLFKALADETRIAMLKRLINVNEMACQELMKEFSLTQPTLSHHFNKLVDAGIINNRKDGVLWFYSINKKFLKEKGININKLIS